MNSELLDYIEREIVPRYEHFDKAHGTSHVRQVMEQSMTLAEHYDVDKAMVYTIAAYHDTGLCEGRERHHITSGEILVADHILQQHFTQEQLFVMRDAVEDHRASATSAPRTIYGRIIAEADRCIDTETVIRRTIQFGLRHYPNINREGHFQRCKEHITEKYSETGYLKLWIPESDNARRLAELRAVAKDEQQFRALFERMFDEEA